MLNWKNYWEVDTALDKTIDWYDAWKKKEDMMKFSLSQINSYENLMKKKQHH
jgi:CDP-glucose 4,6-dehydratase